jgi:hypothetical protein
MGRGQIFSFGKNIWHSQDNILVVDLENDSAEVSVGDGTEEVSIPGLSYAIIDSNEFVDGCEIEVSLYEKINDVESKKKDVEKLIKYIPWLHDIQVVVNGDEISEEFDYDYETEHAYIKLNRGGFGTRAKIYNQGAYVKRERIARTPGEIVTKEDIEVNFARNDILNNCDVWPSVEEEYIKHVEEELLNTNDLTTEERKWLLKRGKQKEELVPEVWEKPLMEDVFGDSVSLAELEGNDHSFSKPGNSVAQDAMKNSATIIIDETYEELPGEIVESSERISYKEVVEEEMKFEMNEVADEDLSKTRLSNLEVLRWAIKEIGFAGSVKAGWSRNENVWMDDSSTIYIHKNYLKAKKVKLHTEVLFEVVKVAALDRDTRNGYDTDAGFKRRYHRLMKRVPEVQQKIINNNTPV